MVHIISIPFDVSAVQADVTVVSEELNEAMREADEGILSS